MTFFDNIPTVSDAHSWYLRLVETHMRVLNLGEGWFYSEQDGYDFRDRTPSEMALSEEGARELNRILEELRYRQLAMQHAETLGLDLAWLNSPQHSPEFQGRVPSKMMGDPSQLRELVRILEERIDRHV